VAKVEAFDLDVGFKYESELEKGIWIVDAKPSATISTMNFYPGELYKPEEGECLFHS
jgi:hypothetical protein